MLPMGLMSIHWRMERIILCEKGNRCMCPKSSQVSEFFFFFFPLQGVLLLK
jgi:hypothetical protein